MVLIETQVIASGTGLGKDRKTEDVPILGAYFALLGGDTAAEDEHRERRRQPFRSCS